MVKSKKIKILIFTILIILLYNLRPPSIVKLEKFSDIGINSDDGSKYLNEYLIIFNPPRKRDKLIKLINNYNKKTINEKELFQEYRDVSRFFYRARPLLFRKLILITGADYMSHEFFPYVQDLLMDCIWYQVKGELYESFTLFLDNGETVDVSPRAMHKQ